MVGVDWLKQEGEFFVGWRIFRSVGNYCGWMGNLLVLGVKFVGLNVWKDGTFLDGRFERVMGWMGGGGEFLGWKAWGW